MLAGPVGLVNELAQCFLICDPLLVACLPSAYSMMPAIIIIVTVIVTIIIFVVSCTETSHTGLHAPSPNSKELGQS